MKRTIRLNESDFQRIVKEAVMNIVKNETFNHHDPDYNEEEAADEMAWRQDAYWDEQMDNTINEAVKRTVKKVMKENVDLNKMNTQFKHVEICEHPLKPGTFMVHNLTFPSIPPFFGTAKECYKAALSAEEKSETKLNKLIQKAREEGYSDEEIQKAVKERLNRKHKK